MSRFQMPPAGTSATKIAYTFAQLSLPLPVRFLGGAAPIGIGIGLVMPNQVARPAWLVGWVAMLLLHTLMLGREVRRSALLVPALTELEDCPSVGDGEILALALARLAMSRPRRVDPQAPAAALADRVRLVMIEADEKSCAQGHFPGCAHRRTTHWWAQWLERHSRPAAPTV